MPTPSITGKLSTWGCPACGEYGNFEEVAAMDYIVCNHCDTWFPSKFLKEWDGIIQPELKGTKGFVDDPEPWDPVPPKQESPDNTRVITRDLYDKLVDLLEKVIRFREVVINPDRVTNDTDIERLLHEMFEITYGVLMPIHLQDELLPLDDDEFEIPEGFEPGEDPFPKQGETE